MGAAWNEIMVAVDWGKSPLIPAWFQPGDKQGLMLPPNAKTVERVIIYLTDLG
jgi:hypothetical protein